MPFDVFIAPLRCVACGALVQDAEIQSHIRAGAADGSTFGLGTEFDAVDLETQHLIDAGYAMVNEPHGGSPIRLLDVWTCPRCDTEQWAIIEIADREIRSIEGVNLDRKTLESANYISEVDAGLLAEALESEEPSLGESSVDILRRLLA